MTLNKFIAKYLKPLAEDHLQINDFGFGDIYQIATTTGVKYPLMWTTLRGATYAGKAFNYDLSLIFADIVKEDLSNALEIQSDMIRVATDIAITLSNNSDENLEIEPDFSFEVFSERFKDMSSGVVLNIKVRSLEALSDCDAPYKSKL